MTDTKLQESLILMRGSIITL